MPQSFRWWKLKKFDFSGEVEAFDVGDRVGFTSYLVVNL